MITEKNKQLQKLYPLFLETFPKIEQVIQETYKINNLYQFKNDLDFLNGIWPDNSEKKECLQNDLIFKLFTNFILGLQVANFNRKNINKFLIDELIPALTKDYNNIITSN